MVHSDFTSFPLVSLDFYAARFQSLCEEIRETAKLKSMASEMQWDIDFDVVEQEFRNEKKVVIVTTPEVKIVHATPNIFEMNGYHPSEIIGKSPKMFQGEKTSKSTQKRIAKAIGQKVPFEATLINYRKDQSRYTCAIKALPITNKQGKVVNFIAFEKEIA